MNVIQQTGPTGLQEVDMMHTPMQKFLGQYIEQVKKEERTFDDWIEKTCVVLSQRQVGRVS